MIYILSHGASGLLWGMTHCMSRYTVTHTHTVTHTPTSLYPAYTKCRLNKSCTITKLCFGSAARSEVACVIRTAMHWQAGHNMHMAFGACLPTRCWMATWPNVKKRRLRRDADTALLAWAAADPGDESSASMASPKSTYRSHQSH